MRGAPSSSITTHCPCAHHHTLPVCAAPLLLHHHTPPVCAAPATPRYERANPTNPTTQLPEPVKLRVSHLLEMEAPPNPVDGRMGQMEVDERQRAAKAFSVDLDEEEEGGRGMMGRGLLANEYVPGV